MSTDTNLRLATEGSEVFRCASSDASRGFPGSTIVEHILWRTEMKSGSQELSGAISRQSAPVHTQEEGEGADDIRGMLEGR